MKKTRVITEARREYLRTYQRGAAKAKRMEWLDAHGPCAACGLRDRCEVDHIEPSAKVSHRIWSWSLARRAVELSKCQVLCYACHKHKTKMQLYGERQHGTWTMYNKGLCRCQDCRKANAAHAMDGRERKRKRNIWS